MSKNANASSSGKIVVEVFRIRDKVTGKFSLGGSSGGICRSYGNKISVNEGKQYGTYAHEELLPEDGYFKKLHTPRPQAWAKPDKHGHGGKIWHRLKDVQAHLAQHKLSIETLPERFEILHGTCEMSVMGRCFK